MSPPSSPPRTPIHAQFATSIQSDPTPTRPKPIVVPQLPRHSPIPPTSYPPPSTSSPEKATIATTSNRGSSTGAMASYPPTKQPSVVRLTPTSSSNPEAALEDGPLFRAHITLLEKRAHSLRHSLKKLGKALELSLSNLRESLAAQAHLDEALEDLGGGGLTGGEDVLGELYERALRGSRGRKRLKLEQEIERTREFGERLRSSVERLKLVEERKKDFESDSKKFYEELSKYLSKPEVDSSKLAASDQKQGERTELFRGNRIEYFSFVEGVVLSEEHVVAAWLVAWENIGQDESHLGIGAEGGADTSREGWVHLDEGKTDTSLTHAQLLDALHLDLDSPSPSLPPSASSTDGRPAPSRSSTLDLPPPVSPALPSEQSRDARRRRRTSLPHWGLSPSPSLGAEKESASGAGGGRRDRLKGFISKSLTSAQNSIQSALPSSGSSYNLFSPTSDSFPPPTSPLLSTPARSPPMPSMPSRTSLQIPSSTPTPASTHPRRKEGFLYATETGQKHSSAGDGGARYIRFWVVLSEGQLIEYDRWSDSLSVHGTPINLRYATARISKQGGERRFCFEVLTPQLRRVYQATSEEECSAWVTAISKSVESLLNGTSSVRHFDPSRISGTDSPSSLPPSHDPFPTSPKGRFAPFLSRHTSLGHARKVSGSAKKDKRRSVQQQQTIPSFRIGEEESFRSDLTSSPSHSILDGLGIPFPSDLRPRHPASRSSPNLLVPRSRTTTSPSEGFSTGDEGEQDDTVSIVSEQDLAISDAVKRWAAGDEPKSPSQNDSKFRNALKIVEIARDDGLGNGKCADCRAPEATWASWSLGIVLCIRCSGLHRGLGSHISKVRSIELDDWSDEQIASMLSVGNSRSNAFFEAEMSPDVLETLDDSTIGTFVRQKYAEKKWVSLVAPTPPSTTTSFTPNQQS
ncbi:uncharacterized protein JCM6883_005212 [Sporobolomyces salmoneus]|uniref:uncharacterized protein n=1 Tax=Sporobolomyces salmoneus TaxID=183962 RepID=UPI003175DA0D